MAKPTSHTLTFPCHVILTADRRGPVQVPIQDSTVGVSLFTEAALLDAYRREHRLQGPLLQFDRSAELLAWMDTLPESVASLILNPDGLVGCCLRLDTLRSELAEGVRKDAQPWN